VLKLSRPPSTARAAAERLHAAAVAQSRTPALYAELGAPDTVEGRFEMLALHLVLLLAMSKRMRKLGALFYGRLHAYSEAFQSLPATEPLGEVIARTVLADVSASAEPLAAYVASVHQALAIQPPGALVTDQPAWPPA
jgi:cytochrome b pre-mRNA-processing protein 3